MHGVPGRAFTWSELETKTLNLGSITKLQPV